MDKEAFFQDFLVKSGMRRELAESVMVVLPCRCGYPRCPGWAMVAKSEEAIRNHNRFFGGGVKLDVDVD